MTTLSSRLLIAGIVSLWASGANATSVPYVTFVETDETGSTVTYSGLTSVSIVDSTSESVVLVGLLPGETLTAGEFIAGLFETPDVNPSSGILSDYVILGVKPVLRGFQGIRISFFSSDISVVDLLAIYEGDSFSGGFVEDGTLQSLCDAFGTCASLDISIQSDVEAVPIPAALPLFAGGLAGLGWFSRRKRKQSQAA